VVTTASADDGAWNDLQLSGTSLFVKLPSIIDFDSDKFYEVTVDAQNELGFNNSLHLQSVILPSNASGTSVGIQFDV